MEWNLLKYQDLSDLSHLADGLDILCSICFHILLISPGKLPELWDHMKKKLIKHFKEYKLAMVEIHEYYVLSLLSYNYTDDMIVLQIPIYVNITSNKHYNIFV